MGNFPTIFDQLKFDSIETSLNQRFEFKFEVIWAVYNVAHFVQSH